MAQTTVLAPESTENVVAARRVRDVATRIAWLDPEAAPFTQLITKGADRKRNVKNTKFVL